MIQPRSGPLVSQAPPGPAPWRQVRTVMAITICVALVSLGLKGCASRSTDETLLLVWAPVAIVLGMGSFWFGRTLWIAMNEPARIRARTTCPKCGSGSLQSLIRQRAGREPLVVGLRCSRCRTTYRPVGDRLVGVAPVDFREPIPADGIHFEDTPQRHPEVQYLEDPDATGDSPRDPDRG